jgi:PIN domain nuclease of toxin-antitoxin system
MIAYLDTNAVLRVAQGRARAIGPDASRLIRRAELLISPMVLLELEYLHEIGRIVIPAQDILRKMEHELSARLCDLPFAEVAKAALGEKWTRDAFDRVIVAQAKVNGLAPLISSDQTIAEHYPRAVW